MTRCEFFVDEECQHGTDNRRIRGFRISGHSEFEEAGMDIVCSAVSAVVIMAETILNDELHANAKVRDKGDANFSLMLPASCDEEEAVQAVLGGFMNTLLYLRDEYPDNIEVLEV
ncbi:MAG: ribosomal-processing cysteine protease Prp [Faecousia sp.]